MLSGKAGAYINTRLTFLMLLSPSYFSLYASWRCVQNFHCTPDPGWTLPSSSTPALLPVQGCSTHSGDAPQTLVLAEELRESVFLGELHFASSAAALRPASH